VLPNFLVIGAGRAGTTSLHHYLKAHPAFAVVQGRHEYDGVVQDLSPAGKKFVTSCNENFDALLRSMVSWADLCNLGDLSVLAALVGGDGLAEKSGWDLAWILDPKGYPVVEMKAPTSAAVLCNYTTNGNNALFLTGGIWIKPAEWAAKRAADDKLGSQASRPEEGWSSVRK